jgi:hypothetical protein
MKHLSDANYKSNAAAGCHSPLTRIVAFASFSFSLGVNASAWTHLSEQPDPSRPIIAFLDADFCHEGHWPKFGGDSLNYDTENGRPLRYVVPDYIGYADRCDVIDQALASPAMTASPFSRLIVLNCDFEEDPMIESRCFGPNRNETFYRKLITGYHTRSFTQVSFQDFGLPAWPVKTIEDYPRENVCNGNRSYLMGYKGRVRNHFPEFQSYYGELAKERPDVYIWFGVDHYEESPHNNQWNGKVLPPTPKENQSAEMYYKLMTQSTFCPVARGDCLYSVRFSEVLSAGCIPILHADGWVLPYDRSIVDWYKLAIIIPQKQVHKTLAVIEAMTEKEICERRLMAYDFFHAYVKNGTGRLDAILKIVDNRMRTGSVEQYQVTPGISTHPDNLKYYKE